MKDILLDIVTHTRAVGVHLLRFSGEEDGTAIVTQNTDRTLVIMAKTHTPIEGLFGVFGVPNLDKLELLLRNPFYQENAKINIQYATKGGVQVPTGLKFENQTESYTDSYRFMSEEVLKEILKKTKSNIPASSIIFEPSLSSIEKFNLKSQVHPDSGRFTLEVVGNDLMMSFGDAANHSGSFVFEPNIKNVGSFQYPIAVFKSIFALHGTKVMEIGEGTIKIFVDSGMATYTYHIVALNK